MTICGMCATPIRTSWETAWTEVAPKPIVCGRCLRDLVRRAIPPLFAEDQMGDCEQCGADMHMPAARPQGGGRTKRFCSGRCRTESHRANQRR